MVEGEYLKSAVKKVQSVAGALKFVVEDDDGVVVVDSDDEDYE